MTIYNIISQYKYNNVTTIDGQGYLAFPPIPHSHVRFLESKCGLAANLNSQTNQRQSNDAKYNSGKDVYLVGYCT